MTPSRVTRRSATRRRALLALACASALLSCRPRAASTPAPETVAARWDVFAVRYGALPKFRVSGLIAGADTARRIDATLTMWLLRGPNGRNVLVDAGFQRADLIARWKPIDYIRPDSAIARAGVKPEAITDVIISHIHWDHFDGANLFPNARIWIQRAEVEHHIDNSGGVLDRAIDAPDARMLHGLRTAGKLSLLDGDTREIMPGISVYIGGKHTFQSQYVGVQTVNGTVVLASDNMYLYENLETHRPIAQTLDSVSNLAAHARMVSLAANRRFIVPGHDPLVFERFPTVAPGVVQIR